MAAAACGYAPSLRITRQAASLTLLGGWTTCQRYILGTTLTIFAWSYSEVAGRLNSHLSLVSTDQGRLALRALSLGHLTTFSGVLAPGR